MKTSGVEDFPDGNFAFIFWGKSVLIPQVITLLKFPEIHQKGGPHQTEYVRDISCTETDFRAKGSSTCVPKGSPLWLFGIKYQLARLYNRVGLQA